MEGKTSEIVFNTHFAQALRSTRSIWRKNPDHISVEELGKGISGHKRPDIIINDGFYPPLIIESSFDAGDADRDAQRRLGYDIKKSHYPIHTSISLHIPQAFRKIRDSDIEACLLSRCEELRYAIYRRTEVVEQERWPRKGYISGSIWDLKTLLPHLALPTEKVSEVGRKIADLVNDAALILSNQLTQEDQKHLSHHLLQRSPLKGLRTMMVLWLNALLVQQRLSVQKVNGVPSVSTINQDYIDPNLQLDVWKDINTRNWRSIFQPAIDVLEKATELNPGAVARTIHSLTKCVMEIEYASLGLHISVGAELFPKLSEDRKRAAAFYTQPATAELLAFLTIVPASISKENWADPLILSSRKLADMACGTGTLLRAGYKRIVDLHERCAFKESDISCVHMSAMEGGVIGVDISPIAAHLTTSSLAALGEGDTYGDTQIGWVEVGGESNKVGALEYFKTNKMVDLHTGTGIGYTSGSGENGNVSVEIMDGSIDWVLMNPPYSRTRKGQSAFDVAGLLEDERKQCQKRWAKLIKGAGAIKTAGMGASFLALANRKLKECSGRLGFVLPLTAAFAESWQITRSLIETRFEDIVAVTISTGKTDQRESLSADTGMGEMLLIATRKDQRLVNRPPPYIYNIHILYNTV